MQVHHRTLTELEAGLAATRLSPADEGTLQLIVRRPAIGKRDVLTLGHLDPLVGLIGDTWNQRESRHTPDRTPHPDMQINIMNARVIALIAGDQSRGRSRSSPPPLATNNTSQTKNWGQRPCRRLPAPKSAAYTNVHPSIHPRNAWASESGDGSSPARARTGRQPGPAGRTRR